MLCNKVQETLQLPFLFAEWLDFAWWKTGDAFAEESIIELDDPSFWAHFEKMGEELGSGGVDTAEELGSPGPESSFRLCGDEISEEAFDCKEVDLRNWLVSLNSRVSFHFDLLRRFAFSCSASAIGQFKFWTTKSMSSGSVSSVIKKISDIFMSII